MTIKEVCERYDVTADTLRYYEKVGMIPPVPRTRSGMRNYGQEELSWLELALCMRSAGLPVEGMIEYRKLFQEGERTLQARLDLLTEQKEILLARKKKIEEMLDRLNYKISRYEAAVKTGKLVWEEHPSVITGKE